jgi:hypothetical protein
MILLRRVFFSPQEFSTNMQCTLCRERCCLEDRNEPLCRERYYLEDENKPLRRAYDILNAVAVLQPTDGLTALAAVLFGIEDRAKLYYFSGGVVPGPDGGDELPPEGSSSEIVDGGGPSIVGE